MGRQRSWQAVLGRGLGVWVLVALASGCASVRMAPPADTSAMELWPVDGHRSALGKDWKVGPYAVEVKQGWLYERDWRLLGLVSGRASQRFQVDLAGRGETVTSQCMWADRVKGVQLGAHTTVDLTDDRWLTCALLDGDETELRLDLAYPRLTRNVRGQLYLPDQVLVVEASYDVTGGRRAPFPVGYTFSRAGEVVAWVESLDQPVVWVRADLPDRLKSVLGTVAVALLVHETLG